MARRYGTFTPARRAALRRASLISAAKRKKTNFKRQRTRKRNIRIQKYGTLGGWQANGRPITRAQMNNRATRAAKVRRVTNTVAVAGVIGAFYGPAAIAHGQRIKSHADKHFTNRKFNKIVRNY